MGTLRDSAMAFKGKRELSDLDKIPVDIEFKTSTFTGKEGKDIPFSFIEIDGYKYNIPGKVMSQIQMVLVNRPTTKHVKVNKTPSGELYVSPLD